MRNRGWIIIWIMSVALIAMIFVSTQAYAVLSCWLSESEYSDICFDIGNGYYQCYDDRDWWIEWYSSGICCDQWTPGDCDIPKGKTPINDIDFVYPLDDYDNCHTYFAEEPPPGCETPPMSKPDAHCEWEYSYDGGGYWDCKHTNYCSDCQVCDTGSGYGGVACNITRTPALDVCTSEEAAEGYCEEGEISEYCDMQYFGCPLQQDCECCPDNARPCTYTEPGDASPIQDDQVSICCEEPNSVCKPVYRWNDILDYCEWTGKRECAECVGDPGDRVSVDTGTLSQACEDAGKTACCYGTCYNPETQFCCGDYCESSVCSKEECGSNLCIDRNENGVRESCCQTQSCDLNGNGIDESCCYGDSVCRKPLNPGIEDSEKYCMSSETTLPSGHPVSYSGENMYLYGPCNDRYDNDGDGKTDCMDPDCIYKYCSWPLPWDDENEYCGVCVRSSEMDGKWARKPYFSKESRVCCGKKDKCGNIIDVKWKHDYECSWDILWPHRGYEKVDYENCYTGSCVSNQAPFQKVVCCKQSFPKYSYTLEDFCISLGGRLTPVKNCIGTLPQINSRGYNRHPDSSDYPILLYSKPVIHPTVSMMVYYVGIQGDPDYSTGLKMDALDMQTPPPDPLDLYVRRPSVREETPADKIECNFYTDETTSNSISGYELDRSTGKITYYNDQLSSVIMALGYCNNFSFEPEFYTAVSDPYLNLPVTLGGKTNVSDDGTVEGSTSEGSMCQGVNKQVVQGYDDIILTPAAATYAANIYAPIDITAIDTALISLIVAGNIFREHKAWKKAGYPDDLLANITLATTKARYANDYGIPDSVTINALFEGDVIYFQPSILRIMPVGEPVFSNALTHARKKLLNFTPRRQSWILHVVKSLTDMPIENREINFAVRKWMDDNGGPSKFLKEHGRVFENITITVTKGLNVTVSDTISILRYDGGGDWIPESGIPEVIISRNKTLTPDDIMPFIIAGPVWDEVKKAIKLSGQRNFYEIVFMDMLFVFSDSLKQDGMISKLTDKINFGPKEYQTYKCDTTSKDPYCDMDEEYCIENCSGEWVEGRKVKTTALGPVYFDRGLWPKIRLFSQYASWKPGFELTARAKIISWIIRKWGVIDINKIIKQKNIGIVEKGESIYMIRNYYNVDGFKLEGEGYVVGFDKKPENNITKVFYNMSNEETVLVFETEDIDKYCNIDVISSETFDVNDDPVSLYRFDADASDEMGNHDGTVAGNVGFVSDEEKGMVASFGSGEMIINGHFSEYASSQPDVPGWITGQDDMWYYDHSYNRMYIRVDSYNIKDHDQVLEPWPYLNIEPGKIYNVKFTIGQHYAPVVTDGAYASIGGKRIYIYGEGDYDQTITAETDENLQFIVPANAQSRLTLDNVSVVNSYPADGMGYIDAGAPVLNGNKVTYGGWIKVNSLTNRMQTIMQQDNAEYKGFALYIDEIDNSIYCWDGNVVAGGFLPELDTWYNAFCIHNGTDFALYINGEMIGNSVPSERNAITTENFVIGGSAPLDSGWFNGSIDDVFIFNKAISAPGKNCFTDPFNELCNIFFTGNHTNEMMFYTNKGNEISLIVPNDAFNEKTTAKIDKVMISNCDGINITPNINMDWNLSKAIDDFDMQITITGPDEIKYPEVYVARWQAGISDLKNTVYNITGYIKGTEHTIFQ